jgi:hypothetical protein
VASALGPGLPPPEQLPLLRTPGTGRGRVGRAVMAWLAPVEGLSAAGSTCRRIAVAPGVEILMDEQHPALRLNRDPTVIAEAMRQALASVIGLEPGNFSAPPAAELPEVPATAWTAALSESDLYNDSALRSEHAE